MTAHERIREHRLEILWWEFCCLLHDIGKLSDDFVRYRQTWHAVRGGYARGDPHDHDWLGRDGMLAEEFRKLKLFFEAELIENPVVSGQVSVANAVNHHIAPKDELGRLLQQGDGIDSAQDRNFPLLAYEQTSYGAGLPPRVFRGNVFGHETEVVPEELDAKRREFYRELEGLLELSDDGLTPLPHWPAKKYDVFVKIRDLMRAMWDRAMSDTTRPNNDTSLWEHAFSVASITKALHASRIAADGTARSVDSPFQIFGVGFDSFRVLASSVKLADVAARKQMLEDAFDEVRKLIEYDVPCGNQVYRDDDQAFFLMAPVGEDLLEWVRAEVKKRWGLAFKGELEPAFVNGGPGRPLTVIPELIDEMRMQTSSPIRDGGSTATDFHKRWKEVEHAQVCPVCRLRPAERGPDSICRVCRARRTKAAGARSTVETPFVTEIGGKPGRVALIVARIGLRGWLDGGLVRTLLVTPPEGVQKSIGALKAFADFPQAGDPDFDEEFAKYCAVREKNHGYAAMLKEFRRVQKELSFTAETRFAPFLYGRGLTPGPGDRLRVPSPAGQHSLQATLSNLATELAGSPDMAAAMLATLCSKSPTPSTLLDVWETTQEFFQDVAAWLPEILPKRKRYKIHLRGDLPDPKLHEGMALDGRIDGRAWEFVYVNPRELWMLGAESPVRQSATIHIGHDAVEVEHAEWVEGVYHPYRVISKSPVRLLMMVPADAALPALKEINRRYFQAFGKVYGRLPLATAVLFFPAHLPMFSVLDAARRTERGFRSLQEGPWVTGPLACPETVNVTLGDGETEDPFHPYLLLADSHTPDAEIDFRTPMGPMVHMARIESQEVKYRPNLLRTAWLGSSAARLDVDLALPESAKEDRTWSLADHRKATTPRRGPEGPMWHGMDFEHEAEALWATLVASELSDTQLRNVLQLFSRRNGAWSKHEGGTRGAAHLAASLLPQNLREGVRTALVNGSFEQMTRLHLGILKERLHQE